MQEPTTYKIVIIGHDDSGKSTFVNRHLTGEFTKEYNPTIGVEVHPLRFCTNIGEICFNVWDCAGKEEFGGLRDGYYIKADACLVFYSLTKGDYYAQTKVYIEAFRRVCPNAPIVLCANKFDLIRPKSDTNYQLWSRRMHKLGCELGLIQYDVSAKSNYQYELPFLSLARRLTGHGDLVFVDAPPITPPEVIPADEDEDNVDEDESDGDESDGDSSPRTVLNLLANRSAEEELRAKPYTPWARDDDDDLPLTYEQKRALFERLANRSAEDR